MIRLSAIRLGRDRLLFGEKNRVAEARAGSREAFDRLVSDHNREIRNFVAKRVGKESADDLVQEIWLAAWGSIREYDARSRFRTWLYGIAINKCKSFYRTQQRRPSFVAYEEASLQRVAPSSPVSDLEAQLPSMIERLSDTHRQLLDLYYYGELTLPEIAKMLNRNLNTVKYQFYRAHAEVAKLIEEGQ